MISLFIGVNSFANNNQTLIFNEHRDGVMLPFNYYLNGAFDVIQNPDWFNQHNFVEKHKVVINRVKNPDRSIRRDGGYKKLIQDEFFSSRVVPNIGLHTLGASYDTFWLNEYFTFYNFPAPQVWTILLSYSVHFGNEALESGHDEITSHDHIADLFFFDILGASLGQSHKFVQFLREDLGMRAWHGQPIYDVKGEDIFNPGLNYIYRPRALRMGKYRPIVYTGMQNMTGVSYDGVDFVHSALMGIALTDPLRQKGRFVVSYFAERNDSLIFSLLLNSGENMRYKFNFFPNFSDYFSDNEYLSHLGLVFGQNRDRNYLLGFNFYLPLGIIF